MERASTSASARDRVVGLATSAPRYWTRMTPKRTALGDVAGSSRERKSSSGSCHAEAPASVDGKSGSAAISRPPSFFSAREEEPASRELAVDLVAPDRSGHARAPATVMARHKPTAMTERRMDKPCWTVPLRRTACRSDSSEPGIYSASTTRRSSTERDNPLAACGKTFGPTEKLPAAGERGN